MTRPLLALQLKKYADNDPGPTPQQAVPLEVIRKVRSWTRNEMDVAIGQLVVVAFFFAMRSCEFSDVRGQRNAVNSGQNGRRPFPEERRDADENGPRLLARRQHCHYHVQEAEERGQRSDGDATLKRQLGTVGHLSHSSHGRPGNESTKLQTSRTDQPENQFDHSNKPGRNLSHPQRPWQVRSGSGSSQIASALIR